MKIANGVHQKYVIERLFKFFLINTKYFFKINYQIGHFEPNFRWVSKIDVGVRNFPPPPIIDKKIFLAILNTSVKIMLTIIILF